jgi:hypothetical protein
MKKLFNLMLCIKHQKLTREDTNRQLIPLKEELKEIIHAKGLYANTGMPPSDLWNVIGVINYATAKELDRQNHLDVRIGNCTFSEACCPGVYSKLLPVHLMNKVDRQVDEHLKSIGFIDNCCTTFDIDALLPGTE